MSENETGNRMSSEAQGKESFKKKIFLRKLLLYVVLIVAFLISLIRNIYVQSSQYELSLDPQIDRAVIQIAKIIPQLERGEEALWHIWEGVLDSWKSIEDDGLLEGSDYTIPDKETELEQFARKNLSWMDMITMIKVGRDGGVVVLDKETMTVIAHPDKDALGIQLVPHDPMTKDNVVDLDTIIADSGTEDLQAQFNLFTPRNPKNERLWELPDISDYLFRSVYGCAMEYDDYYIICGISLYERISFLGIAFLTTVIVFILIWIIVRWICFVIDARSENEKSMRAKLIAYSLIVCIISFGVSVYIQVLSNAAVDSMAVSHHADEAVDTFETFQEQSSKLEKYLDSFYEIQCRLASMMIQKKRASLDRDTIQKYADSLNVKYIYLFDQEGNVVVTNSNYDHLKIGSTPEEPFYEFQALLDGEDSVILPPVKDGDQKEKLQYVGVSIRNDEDLCDGFVMIGVDPALRNALLDTLMINAVLNITVIGLPDYAVAVNEETMKVTATTGAGYVGESIEELGLLQEDLEEKNSCDVVLDDGVYNVGVDYAGDQYILPILRRTDNEDVLISSFILMLEAAWTLVVLILMTLFRFKETVPDSDPEEEKADEEKQTDSVDEVDEELKKLFSDDNIRSDSKDVKSFESRWNVGSWKMLVDSPEGKIMKTIYYLLLFFCLFILLPTLFVALNSHSKISGLSTLAYVISGRWEKGVNIFAVTSCILLLCAMYVISVLLDMILYRIARANDTRVETVCLLIRNSIKYICVIIFIYYGLSKFGVNTKTLLASAGILSLMVSLGAKDMVSDILAGFFIIFECSYRVGDYVEIGSWGGVVTEIGLRTTKVKRGSKTKIFNNASMRDIVSTERIAKQTIKMGISYDSDIEEVKRILDEELAKLGPDKIPGLQKAPTYGGISSFEDSSIEIEIDMKVDNLYRSAALSALNHEVLLIFNRNGIEMPYNQIVVHKADGEAD